jgi:hypothetical protein
MSAEKRIAHYIPTTKELMVYSLQDVDNPVHLDVHPRHSRSAGGLQLCKHQMVWCFSSVERMKSVRDPIDS